MLEGPVLHMEATDSRDLSTINTMVFQLHLLDLLMK
jgi:hypothetical protein